MYVFHSLLYDRVVCGMQDSDIDAVSSIQALN